MVEVSVSARATPAAPTREITRRIVDDVASSAA
jgi:hypothetical protein